MLSKYPSLFGVYCRRPSALFLSIKKSLAQNNSNGSIHSLPSFELWLLRAMLLHYSMPCISTWTVQTCSSCLHKSAAATRIPLVASLTEAIFYFVVSICLFGQDVNSRAAKRKILIKLFRCGQRSPPRENSAALPLSAGSLIRQGMNRKIHQIFWHIKPSNT